MVLRDFPDIVRPAPPLVVDDTAARAIRLLRSRGLPALLVAHDGQLVGMVYEDDLVALAVEAAEPGSAVDATRVSQLMRPIEVIARDDQEIGSVVRMLRDASASVTPVIAGDGRYLGIVLRRDLLAALVGESPVPPIAGLATPFGVYLTTGAVRAGAGDLALAATGVSMATIYLIAMVAWDWLSHQGLPLLGDLRPLVPAGAVLSMVLDLLPFAVFLILLRLSPLAGIHAAEHMVVHAIEEGEDLVVQKVRAMSRVHRRCGTNLMALLVLISAIAALFWRYAARNAASGPTGSSEAATYGLVVLAVIALLMWRRLGAGLQRWLTTKRPADRQLLNAIAVGEELLAKVRTKPHARVGFPRRIWNTGFLQVVAGFAAVTALAGLFHLL